MEVDQGPNVGCSTKEKKNSNLDLCQKIIIIIIIILSKYLYFSILNNNLELC
jgi:hypothetical protein